MPRKIRFLVVVFSVVIAGCQTIREPNLFQIAGEHLYNGRTREAVETFAKVPWSAPEVEAARAFMSQLATRIDLFGSRESGSNPKIDVVEIVGTLPHDTSCFTEGLEFDGNALIESCGGYGNSAIRRIDVETGKVLRETRLGKDYFAEGTTQFLGKIFLLTWLEQVGLIFDSALAQQESHLTIRGEGWGLTHDDNALIYSNGTHQIQFIDPATGGVTKAISVFNGDVPLVNINELEYVNGEILANIWLTDRIARIDPDTGQLKGWILAEGLLPNSLRNKANVMNGIAYDAARQRLFLTGKLWPYIFIVRLKPLLPAAASPDRL